MKFDVITIDQTLHGYLRGHRELAASVKLDERSRTTMLMMSDLIGSSELRNDQSYLTIYPLKSASRHVVARTWPAGQNYRPGSVWTHSLLLDYQALSLITDPTILWRYFVQPNNGDTSSFQLPLQIRDDQHSQIDVSHDPRLGNLIRQIYGSQQDTVVSVPTLDPLQDEYLALSVWRQMWPGMRRDFAALTNSGDGAVVFDAGCVLRFSERVRSAPPETDERIQAGLKRLEADLPKPGPTELRQFLARYVIEAKEPRRLAAALTSSEINAAQPAHLNLKYLRQKANAGSLPRLTRDLLNREFSKIDNSRDLLELVDFTHNDSLEIDLKPVVGFAPQMSKQDLKRLMTITGSSRANSLGEKLYLNLVDGLPLDALAEVIEVSDLPRLWSYRPELMYFASAWPDDDAARATLINRIQQTSFDVSKVLQMLGLGLGPQAAMAILEKVGILDASQAVFLLNSHQADTRMVAGAWVLQQPARMRALLPHAAEIGRSGVDVLVDAQIQRESAQIDASGWATLIKKALSTGGSKQSSGLYAIGFVAATKLTGREGLVLARAVFDPLLEAIRNRSLKDVERDFINRHTADTWAGWFGPRTLIAAALLKWPPVAISPGALLITSNEAVRDAMVQEIVVRSPKHALEQLRRLPQISEKSRALIEERLKPSVTRRTASPWAWLFGE